MIMRWLYLVPVLYFGSVVGVMFAPVPAWTIATYAVSGCVLGTGYLTQTGHNYRTRLELAVQIRAGGQPVRGAMMPTRQVVADPAAYMAGLSPNLIPADEWKGEVVDGSTLPRTTYAAPPIE